MRPKLRRILHIPCISYQCSESAVTCPLIQSELDELIRIQCRSCLLDLDIGQLELVDDRRRNQVEAWQGRRVGGREVSVIVIEDFESIQKTDK